MQRAVSTHVFLSHRLTTVWLDRIWDAGIPQVEFYCARQHLDYHNRAQISELGYWFRDRPLQLHSVHSPIHNDESSGVSGPQSIINITEPVKNKRIPMIDEIKRALDIAEVVPFRYLVQHLGVVGQEYDERSVDAAFTALEEISLFARQRGVEVLLENIPNAHSSAERLMMFLGVTHLPLNVCFDLGHAHMLEGVETAYRMLKDRIRSIHVHDNHGAEDEHLLPLAGAIDWPRAMQMLRSQPDLYPLLFEVREMPDVEMPLDELRRVFDTLDNLKVPDES